MKRLFIALALLAPVAAQANSWDVVCGGVKMNIVQDKAVGAAINKGGAVYPAVGGTTYNGNETDVYARWVKNEDGKMLVDATDSFEIIQSGVDNKTVFHFIDGRGNHPCSVQSFKAGE